MATRQPFRKWGHWKWIGSYPYTCILPLLFGVDIQSQTEVSPETKKSNMAARQPFWKWHHWKLIGSYPYIQVLCQLSLELIFKAKLKLESGNQKIQYGRQAAILKVTCWKSIGFCLWPPSTCIWNLKLKFHRKLDLCSGNHVVYRQTDGRTDKVNPVYPPSNFVGRGYNDITSRSELRLEMCRITQHWQAISRYIRWKHHLGLYSLSDKTSYCKIWWCFEAAIWDIVMTVSLKFDRYLSSSAAKVPVKFQSD